MTQDQHPLAAADQPVEQGARSVPETSGAALTEDATSDTQTESFASPAPTPAAAEDAHYESADAVADDADAIDDDLEDEEAGGGYVRFRTPFLAVAATILSLALLALIAGNVYQFVHNGNNQVIATVNGSKITQTDFVRDDANSQQTLDDLIANKLVLQEAARQKVSISNSAIDGQIATIKKQVGTAADFQTALKNNNLTESELRDRIRINLLEMQLGAKGVTVSDAEAQTYYNQNKAQFGTQTFDQAKGGIEAQLLQQKQSTAVQSWIAGLRKNAKVNIHLPT